MRTLYATGETKEQPAPGFPEWSADELAAQRQARAAIREIPLFPELERRLIRLFGPTPEAIALHQIVYWFSKQQMQPRWTLYKTFGEWHDERGLNRRQIEKARLRLKPTGLVAETKGPYKRVHYRVDWLRLRGVLDNGRLYPLKGGQSMSVLPKGGSITTVPPEADDTGDSHAGETPEGGESVATVPPTIGYELPENPHRNGRNEALEVEKGRHSPTQENTQESTSGEYAGEYGHYNSDFQSATKPEKSGFDGMDNKSKVSKSLRGNVEIEGLRELVSEARRRKPDVSEEGLLKIVLASLISHEPTARKYLGLVLSEDAA